MLKHNPERIHRKVLRKAKKHFVTVTLAGGLVGLVGTQAVSAAETNGNDSGEGVVSTQDDSTSNVEVTVSFNTDNNDGQSTPNDQPGDVQPGTGEGQSGANVETTQVTGSVDQRQNDGATSESSNEEQILPSQEPSVSDNDYQPVTIPEVPDRPEGTRRATIVHTNDLHGRISRAGESDYDLGMGYIKSIADAYRELSDEVILLDAGDAFHGTTSVNLSEGENMVRLMNEAGYKALSPGNHEFNYGTDKLLELGELADFDLIASNVEYNETGEQVFDTFTEWTVFGQDIGIIGVGSQDTRNTTHPANITEVTFTDEVEAVQSQIDELSDQFSKFILLSHAGFEVDQEIARQVPELELIIGGHSHTPVIGGHYVAENERTLIVQAWEHGKLVGVVHLDFDDEGNIVQKSSQVVTLADNFEADDEDILDSLPASIVGNPEDIVAVDGDPDPAIGAILEDIQDSLDEELNVVIGASAVHLDGERANVRVGETNLGNLITDAVREFTGSDIAFVNGGGIRDSIEAGEVTIGDVITVLPFINLVETANIPGSVLLEALEHGMRLYPEQNGALLHVSGMKYVVDATREPGDRVVYAEVNGEVLDPEKVYNVATNDFLLAGGDGYDMLQPFETELVTGELFSDVLIDYIANHEGPVAPTVEGRIVVSDEALDEDSLAEIIAEITDGQAPVVDGETDEGEDQEGGQDQTDDQEEAYDLEDLVAGLEDLEDYLESILGKDKSQAILDSLTLEEFLALADAYQEDQESVEEAVKVVAAANEEVAVSQTSPQAKGETLPDTATSAWLLGLLGLTTLSGGLVLGKKD